jgi:hypothetical protein
MQLPSDHDPFTMPSAAPITTAIAHALPRTTPQGHSMNNIADDPRVVSRRDAGRTPRTRTANLALETISPETMVCQLVLRLDIASPRSFLVSEKILDIDATLLRLGWSSRDQDFRDAQYTPAVVSEIQRVVESVASNPSADGPAGIIAGIRQVLKV